MAALKAAAGCRRCVKQDAPRETRWFVNENKWWAMKETYIKGEIDITQV